LAFCDNCGEELLQEENACPNCGSVKIEEESRSGPEDGITDAYYTHKDYRISKVRDR
jgi:hypothetical protein